jgi:uncharacterized protein (TIGR03083 family)
MNKEELLDVLEEGREEFLETIAGLTDEDLERPGCVGEWSVKDVLIHISRWEAELVKMLWQIKQGQRPTSQQFIKTPVDEINRLWAAEYHQRPLELALDDFESVRRQTVRRIEAFSNDELTDPRRYPWQQGRPLFDWIAEDSFRHEGEHAVQIRAWRLAQGL